MTSPQPLAPALLGFWTRCIRDTMHWSQDALAEASGLTCRTIQRIEAGGRTSLTTRRSLARGLGYSNPDIFDDPDFAVTLEGLMQSKTTDSIAALKNQYPDHQSVPVEKVENGDILMRLVEQSNAYLFHCDDELELSIKEKSATLFDYLRDVGDIAGDVSFSEKLEYGKEVDDMVREITSHSAQIYWATRSQRIVGENWTNKTPITITTGYVTIINAEKQIKHIMVPKRLS